MRFHHIGYAVADIAAYRRDFFDEMYLPESVTEPIHDPIQRVRVCFAQMRGGTVIELVEPTGTDSQLSDIIGSLRGGVYHLCYEVDDLDFELRRFRAKRCMPLGRPEPAVAFDGRRIMFLMTPQRDLIELLERKRA